MKIHKFGDLRPHDLTASRAEQTRSVFDQIEAALAHAGLSVEHLARTWFYLDGILDWYGEFNAVRTSVFEEWGLMGRVLPASTGVGIPNSYGAALVAEAIAIPSPIEEVVSPLQCAAVDYCSSFSRAVEVQMKDRRTLYVSGTAGIAPDGRTAYAGDLERQVALSLDVVREILRSRTMDWQNVTRGVAYFKNPEAADAKLLPQIPLSIVRADICREDLLFEIEVDAVSPA